MNENIKIPNHVAIILDGNGRWAKEKCMPRSEGHSAGFERLKQISPYILSKGVKILSVYAFSTENFKRSKEEVNFLMNLFVNKFKTEGKYFNEKNIKVIFSGRRKSPLPKVDINDLDEAMFSKYLYQDLAPIDLLIRTSGENRISNFMLWQLSYSEFYFPKTYFPDFDEKQFDLALLEYNRRDRRFGGIKNEEKNN